MIDDRASSVSVVTREGETSRAALHEGNAPSIDHAGDRGGVGVDVGEEFRSAGSEAAAVDGESLVGGHEETTGAEGQGVGGGDVDGRRGTRVDAE